MYQFKEKIELEGFLQKEFNHFINLNNRELIGSGLRLRYTKNFLLGIGVMYENELYKNFITKNKNIKSTNYINYRITPNENISITNILYYQFKLSTIEHFRILWDGSINIKGTEWISFNINFKYRYDISNINLNGSSYFEITNGVRINF